MPAENFSIGRVMLLIKLSVPYWYTTEGVLWTKLTAMGYKHLFPARLLLFSLFLVSCNRKDRVGNERKINPEIIISTVQAGNDGMVPKIDTSGLKDEVSILTAMQKVVDARLADDKKKNDDPAYEGHYLELTKLYTSVLAASGAYIKTLNDPAKARAFDQKLSTIQDKMIVN